MGLLTLMKQPVWTRPPITPWHPPLTPLYTGGTDGVYTTEAGEETVENVGVTDIVGDVAFLQPGKPVVGDFMMFTSMANYWYVDPELKIKFSLPGHPVDDFKAGRYGYAGIFQGKISTYIDYKKIKRVGSFLVKIKMPYNAEGNLADTDFLLWIGAESAFGELAEDQFALTGNGYGNNGTVPPNTGTPNTETPNTGTGTTNTETKGTNMKWVIIIGIIFLWLITKK